MKNYFFAFFLLATFFLQAQHTISGTFTPAKEYKWLIAYRLKPGTQVYVADTAIKNGEFALSIPENAVEGTYRFVYAIPQEEFYFDVIYNGKENIELMFPRVYPLIHLKKTMSLIHILKKSMTWRGKSSNFI